MDKQILKLLNERYFLEGETSWDDLSNRVSGIYPPILKDIQDKKFIPSTPTLMNANTNGERKGTLSSCFTMDIEDSIEGIFDAVKEAALVTKAGGGVGFVFSKLRGSKENISTLNAESSGPLPFMNLMSVTLDSLRQGGKRAGAGMGQFDINHPNILDVIRAKDKKGVIERLNLTIRIPDEFYEKLKHSPDFPHIVYDKGKNPYPLEDNGKIVTVKKIWDEIVEYAWRCAEPGIANVDIATKQCTVTNLNPFVLSNPCQEYWNIPYSSCNLGSINLTKCIKDGKFDWSEFIRLVRVATRFLDKVIDANDFPIEKIRDVTLKVRPIGLGTMAWGHMLYLLRIPFNSLTANQLANELYYMLTMVSMDESCNMAQETGQPYPAFDYDLFMKANDRFFSLTGLGHENEKINFMNSVKDKVKQYGVRNSCFTSIAPNGSISYLAGMLTGGIEPVFALTYSRKIEKLNREYETVYISDPIFDKYLTDNFDDKTKMKILKQVADSKGSCQSVEEIPEEMRKVFVVAGDLTPMEHLESLAIVAKNTSLSVSKCIAKGTKINTNEGIISIEDIGYAKGIDKFDTVNSPNLKVRDINGDWQKVVSHYSNGVQPTKIIKFDNGNSLECTYNHKLYNNSWIEAKELKIGQYVYARSVDHVEQRKGNLDININSTRNTNANMVFLPTIMNDDLAKFLGMMVSDGSLTESTGYVGITTADDVVESVFKKLSHTLFGIDTKVIYDKHTKNTRSVYITSRLVYRYVKQLVGKGCVNKNIPIQILNGSKSEQVAFINGLTLDGYIARNKLVLYEGYSKELVDNIFTICCGLGLKPNKSKKYVKNGRLSKYTYYVCVNEKYFTPLEHHKQKDINGYNLIPIPEKLSKITRKEVVKHEGDEYTQPYKNFNNRRYSNSMRTNSVMLNFTPNYDKNLYLVKIVDIIDSENDVFDIEVENTHSYLIDNIISHNTINLPSNATREEISEVYLKAHELGVIGVTVYRDGCRDGILLHKTDKDNKDIIMKTNSPKRPKKLPSHVYRVNILNRTTNESEKWVVFIGLLNDEPYEIMAGKINGIDFDSSITEGEMVKIKRDGKSVYQFCFNDYILVDDVQGAYLTGLREYITRLMSWGLRHGAGIEYLQRVLQKSDGSIVDFNKAIIRCISKYIKDQNTKEKCPTCNSELKYLEGCVKCSDPECSFSKCG